MIGKIKKHFFEQTPRNCLKNYSKEIFANSAKIFDKESQNLTNIIKKF